MVKQIVFTYKGMNQDITKSVNPAEFYHSASNVRITNTTSQSTLSISNEKGNTLEITLPTVSVDTDNKVIIYGNSSLPYTNPEIDSDITSSKQQTIIGHAVTRDSIILISTDNSGFDCIWEVKNALEDSYTLVLLYCRNLGLSTSNPVQVLFNYENDIIQKIYWVDGNQQLSFINIKHSVANGDNEELIDISSSNVRIVSEVTMSQPRIMNVLSGGIHTAGKIQYAYNLYRLNGQQTKISPLSEMVSLGFPSGQGGDVNEVVGASPSIIIDNVDTSYTNIKLYYIKYTTYNAIPEIALIADEQLSSSVFSFLDDGNIISTLSVEEFLFLGSDVIIPEHIMSKDNTLFLANVKERYFKVDLDCRAYAFSAARTAEIGDNVNEDLQGTSGRDWAAENTLYVSFEQTGPSYVSWDTVPEDFDCVNMNYDIHKYQEDGVTRGAEGKYIKVYLLEEVGDGKNKLKDDEIYRYGIEFQNIFGQKSEVKWISDLMSTSGNLKKEYNIVKFELKPEFNEWLSNPNNFETVFDKPVGYRIVRAQRNYSDRTILCEGIINGMMSNTTDKTNGDDISSENKEKALAGNIMPSLQRVYNNNKYSYPMFKMQDTTKMNAKETQYLNPTGVLGEISLTSEYQSEVFRADAGTDQRSDTYQFNRLMMFYSPDITFGTISVQGGLKLRVKGVQELNTSHFWGAEINNSTSEIIVEGKTMEAMSPQAANAADNQLSITGSVFDLCDMGIFAPNRAEKNAMEFIQHYRDFTGTYEEAAYQIEKDIYGVPEIVERGQGLTNYNDDADIPFYNTLLPMITDREVDSSNAPNYGAPGIQSVNSAGGKCLSIVLDGPSVEWWNRTSAEQLFTYSGATKQNSVMIVEIKIPEVLIYTGNIYGGNSYESKKRNIYIGIGEYKNIDLLQNKIEYPGDIYVGDFKFLKMGPEDTEVRSKSSMQISEIVNFTVESTVDVTKRNDDSFFPWDSNWQPKDDVYHKYNTVYSQEPNLVASFSQSYNFKSLERFDNRIIATKTKLPGEFIDSWSDILINEFIDLDGKYGPINSLIEFRDKVYALQDEGVSQIVINPNVQIQADDGISIELGKGGLFYDSAYITTKSGSINKWSVLSTDSGIYYFDALNKSFNRIREGLEGLSDSKGLHAYFNNNTEYDIIKEDNPILKQGAVVGYNPINNDVYLTLLQNNSFTVSFNEMTDSFISFHDFHPSRYIVKGFKMFTPNTSNNEIWEHFKGPYNSYYGTVEDSSITYLVNPQERDCVFNNVEYKSEFYIDDIDQPNSTLTHIQAENEYQSTADTQLVLHSNLQRKFRMWRANIPRALNGNNPSLDRMRGHWIYLTLSLKDNDTNQKMILHHMTVYYTGYPY